MADKEKQRQIQIGEGINKTLLGKGKKLNAKLNENADKRRITVPTKKVDVKKK